MPPDDSSSRPFRSRGRARERTSGVAEQLRLEQLVAEDGAVDRHEDRASARPFLVDRPSDQLLAGAGLAFDHHRERRGSDAATRGIVALKSHIGSLSPTSRATPRSPAAVRADGGW